MTRRFGGTAMNWQCGECGTQNEPAVRRCTVCRAANLPARLVLRSEATGREAEITQRLLLGRAALRQKFGDPDAQYAADEQFELYRDDDAVAWIVRPVSAAVNPTYYNGTAVAPGGAELSEDGVISIGRSRLKLVIRFKAK